MEALTFWGWVKAASDDECWEWTGARKGRYGYGRYRGKNAHRTAYELSKGTIPAGMLVRHSCDNPPCCNPRHLLLGTHKDNTSDAIKRNRLAMGERHGKTKLTAEIVAYIRSNPLGLAGCDLAVLYGVSAATISYIRSGRSWKKRTDEVDSKARNTTFPIWVSSIDGSMGCFNCDYKCPNPDHCRKFKQARERTQNKAASSAINPPTEFTERSR